MAGRNQLFILWVALIMLPGCAELKLAGKEVGHGARDAAREVGHASRDAAKAVAAGASRVWGQVVSEGE